jgi:hypothetical protein
MAIAVLRSVSVRPGAVLARLGDLEVGVDDHHRHAAIGAIGSARIVQAGAGRTVGPPRGRCTNLIASGHEYGADLIRCCNRPSVSSLGGDCQRPYRPGHLARQAKALAARCKDLESWTRLKQRLCQLSTRLQQVFAVIQDGEELALRPATPQARRAEGGPVARARRD